MSGNEAKVLLDLNVSTFQSDLHFHREQQLTSGRLPKHYLNRPEICDL